MTNEVKSVESQKNALSQIVQFEEGLLNFLDRHEFFEVRYAIAKTIEGLKNYSVNGDGLPQTIK